MRLERPILAASTYGSNDLVCAGPGSVPRSKNPKKRRWRCKGSPLGLGCLVSKSSQAFRSSSMNCAKISNGHRGMIAIGGCFWSVPARRSDRMPTAEVLKKSRSSSMAANNDCRSRVRVQSIGARPALVASFGAEVREFRSTPTRSGAFDLSEFVRIQTNSGWTIFSGLALRKTASGETDR